MIFTYFRKKNAENIVCFLLKLLLAFEKIDLNIGFWEKRQFVRRKLAKIAENCDHTTDS
jgi:hypothetical protein